MVIERYTTGKDIIHLGSFGPDGDSSWYVAVFFDGVRHSMEHSLPEEHARGLFQTRKLWAMNAALAMADMKSKRVLDVTDAPDCEDPGSYDAGGL